MKKFLCFAFCLCLCCSLLACGGKPSPSTAPSAEQSAQPSEEPSVEASVQESTAPSATPGVEPSAAPSVEPSVGVTSPVVEPSVDGIIEEYLLSLVTFPSRTLRYNGTRQKLEVKTLPEGATLSFAINDQTTSAENIDEYDLELGAEKPGVYGVTATVTLNEKSVTLSAVLTINKARLTVAADHKEIDLYAPHPEFTYTVTGLVNGDLFSPGQDPAAEEPTPSVEASVTPSVEGGTVSGYPVDPLPTFTGWLTLSTTATRYAELGIYDIIPEGLTSDCYDITFKKGRLTVKNYTTNLIVGGLKQNGANQMTYNGKAISWQGVNNFGLWMNCFNMKTGELREDKVQQSFLGLEELASYNVKAVRFTACFFYDTWWNSTWFASEEHQEVAIKTLHRIFNKAASLNIGLIPSVWWTRSLMGVFGEKENLAWSDPNSQTWQYSMQYQTILLENFNDHPALLFWEHGNEWNCNVDVQNDADIDERLTSTTLKTYRKAWTDLIQSYNKYGRVIGSGDGHVRECHYNKFHFDSWAEDTIEQSNEYLTYINEGITAFSNHVYGSAPLPVLMGILWSDRTLQHQIITTYGITEDEFKMAMRKDFYENPERYTGEGGLFEKYGVVDDTVGRWLADIDTLTEYFTHFVAAAKLFGASCYIGETGVGYTYGETVLQKQEEAIAAGIYPDLTYEDMRAYSQNVSKAQAKTGLSLILYWNYEYGVDISNRAGKPNGNWNDRGTGTEYSWNPTNFEKARIILGEIKLFNDAWDAKNA